jgi:hypothetical protein
MCVPIQASASFVWQKQVGEDAKLLSPKIAKVEEHAILQLLILLKKMPIER